MAVQVDHMIDGLWIMAKEVTEEIVAESIIKYEMISDSDIMDGKVQM